MCRIMGVGKWMIGERKMEFNENYYTKNFSNFDEWFELLENGEKVYPQFRIPYAEWLDNYIKDINKRSLDEVKKLLRHLLIPINRKLDVDDYESYLRMKNSDIEEHRKFFKKLIFHEKFYRIVRGYYAWEGITWILELLPYSPHQAIIALEGYSNAQDGLPDDRIYGIQQCIEIIYAKCIFSNNTGKSIFNLKPKEFEWLIEELYRRMGYETIWTPATRDGGKDIIASMSRPDGIERVYVECKLYKTTKLTNIYVNNFANIINNDKINRGIIFCTGYVNKKLHEIDKRITILPLENIIVLLNAHLGSNWEERLDKIIEYKRSQFER